MSSDENDPFELHAARFLSRLQRLTQSFRASSEPVEVLLAAFDKQRPQIDAAFAWVAAKLDHLDSAAVMCLNFAGCGDPCGGGSLLGLRQNPSETRHWIDKGLDACRRLGCRNIEAVFRHQLAGAMVGDGRFDEAKLHAEAAFQYFQEVGDDRQAAITRNLLGLLSQVQGDADGAIDIVHESLATFRRLESDDDITFTLIILAGAYIKATRFEDALCVADEARRRARERGDHRNEVRALEKLASACFGLERQVEAFAAEFEAAEVLEASDVTLSAWGVGLGMFDLLRLFATKTPGDYQKLKEDLIAFRKVGNWVSEGVALMCLGAANVYRGDRQAGMAFLEQARDLFTKRQYALGSNAIHKFLTDAGISQSESSA